MTLHKVRAQKRIDSTGEKNIKLLPFPCFRMYRHTVVCPAWRREKEKKHKCVAHFLLDCNYNTIEK